MMSTLMLRNYQIKLIEQLFAAWNAGHQNVLIQLPTGGGKTIITSEVIKQLNTPTIFCAHRMELISQPSLVLAQNNIPHDIITNSATIRSIISIHMQDTGRNWYKPGASIIVASIDTLIKQKDSRFRNIQLLVMDEAHHVLKKNKWGKAVDMFPQAKGLYLTATPVRADGFGLGRHADGVIDHMIHGPSGRELINDNFLSPYIIYNPSSHLDLSNVPVTSSGDYSASKLKDAIGKSRIVGDVVEHYLKYAKGKLGITFAANLENAVDISQAYKKRGIPAEVISGNTPITIRAKIMKDFRDKRILQLVNVDILGEGVDVPAVEVVSFARPTHSYTLYCQQFGRALRLSPGKEKAIILDHVDNLYRHGLYALPDIRTQWSLDRRERRKSEKSDEVTKVKTCLNIACLAVYERIHKCCPYCGHFPEPAQRSLPEHVDGDLTELDIDALLVLQNKIKKIDGNPHPPSHLDQFAQRAVIKRHLERQRSQKELREIIALWAGLYKTQQMTDSMIYRKFYIENNIDILTAQTLGINEAEDLIKQLKKDLTMNQVELNMPA